MEDAQSILGFMLAFSFTLAICVLIVGAALAFARHLWKEED